MNFLITPGEIILIFKIIKGFCKDIFIIIFNFKYELLFQAKIQVVHVKKYTVLLIVYHFV